MATKGFVLGKFMPPHKGHVFLCSFARNHCDELTIMVCSMPGEPIDGRIRFTWMQIMYPDCKVVWCRDTLPQEPKDEHDADFWEKWKDAIHRHTIEFDNTKGTWEPPKYDYVYASEDYGHKLAKTLDAEFVPCDIKRLAVPVSGTMCRSDPAAQWEYLPEIVRPYYQKRVCTFGPESCGKSTLAAELAEIYNTTVVPEYGRTYTETFGPDVKAEDLLKIAQGHIASRDAAKFVAGRILIEDTDPVMTAVWSDMLIGKRDPYFADYTDYADLYLLCSPDIPWENDGTRYFENEEDRWRFFELCRTELEDRGVDFVVISGDAANRIAIAKRAIDKRF